MEQEDFFKKCATDLAFSKKKCKELQNDKEYLEDRLNGWEGNSCAPGISNPVRNNEPVIRQLIQPQHWDPVEGLTPTAINDVLDKGLSVNRVADGESIEAAQLRCAQTAIKRVQSRIAERPELEGHVLFAGLSVFATNEVRKILSPCGRRAFYVFDTASEEDPTHADICGVVKGEYKGVSRMKSAKSQLFDLVKAGVRLRDGAE